jgi:hypothetical protein
MSFYIFLFFLARCYSETFSETHYTTRLILNLSFGTATITNCVFVGITVADAQGGAIYNAVTYSETAIEDTTMLTCVCTATQGYGVALHLHSRRANISRVCACDCVGTRGPFVYTPVNAVNQTVLGRELSALRCPPPNTTVNYQGAITSSWTVSLDLANANITDCHSTSDGSRGAALDMGGPSVTITVKFGTFLGMGGDNCIYHYWGPCAIDSCNFVGNMNKWVLFFNDIWVRDGDGPSEPNNVTRCYFYNNSGAPFVFEAYRENKPIFWYIADCFFDRPYLIDPRAGWTSLTIAGPNYFSTEFTTLFLWNIDTEACPGSAAPSRSFAPSISFRASAQFAPSDRFAASAQLPASNRFLASPNLPPSRNLVPSDPYPASHNFGASNAFVGTNGFRGSNTFGASNKVLPSPNLPPSRNLAPSDPYPASRNFGASNAFVGTNGFRGSNTFGASVRFVATQRFDASSHFAATRLRASESFPPSATPRPTKSRSPTATAGPTDSRSHTPAQSPTESESSPASMSPTGTQSPFLSKSPTQSTTGEVVGTDSPFVAESVPSRETDDEHDRQESRTEEKQPTSTVGYLASLVLLGLAVVALLAAHLRRIRQEEEDYLLEETDSSSE